MFLLCKRNADVLSVHVDFVKNESLPPFSSVFIAGGYLSPTVVPPEFWLQRKNVQNKFEN